jgi:hypothetical protein
MCDECYYDPCVCGDTHDEAWMDDIEEWNINAKMREMAEKVASQYLRGLMTPLELLGELILIKEQAE